MNEFLTWTFLATYAGAVVGTTTVVQFIKMMFPKKELNAQVISYIVAAIIMTAAHIATTEGVVASELLLVLINAIVVSLASNGAYDLVTGKPAPVGKLVIDTTGDDKDLMTIEIEDLGTLVGKDKIQLQVENK